LRPSAEALDLAGFHARLNGANKDAIALFSITPITCRLCLLPQRTGGYFLKGDFVMTELPYLVQCILALLEKFPSLLQYLSG